MDKLKPIWDISLMKVIMNSEHPLKTNRYEPALIIHFGNYVQSIIKKINDSACS